MKPHPIDCNDLRRPSSPPLAGMPTETETVSIDLLDKIQSLYDQGLNLQAFELSKQAGPLEKWTGIRSRVLAARISNHVGSMRMGRTLMRLAHRAYPNDPEINYFHTYSMLGRWGAYKTFQSLNRLGELDGADDVIKSDWFALRGMLYAFVRDFEQADHWIERAVAMHPKRAWLHVQRSTVLELQDRPKEAVAAAELAMDLQPWFRPAVQNLANRLVQEHRDDEAIKLMQDANQKIESGDVRIQLASLFLELERFDEAQELYADIESYFPMLKQEPKVLESLAALNADMQYYVGNHTKAAEHAKQAKDPFFDALAGRLTDSSFIGKRIRLPVKFVRQDHLTCAPATLTSIANYWEKPVEHLDIVEEICYDGTPAHSERKWANDSDYVTREFCVTWESAKALIDRGIPFTLTTCDPGSAHLQAVIGYDDYRRSFLIRDPGDRHSKEFNVEKMLKYYAATGPRGMAMVPAEKADLLVELELPETEFYDLNFQMQLKLDDHDREQAAELIEQMIAKDASHRMTLNARSIIARYDSDLPQMLSILDSLREKYPEDVNINVTRLTCLGELGKAEDRISTLREINAEPKCDPIFWNQLAGELLGDAREKKTVDYLIRRSLKHQSGNADAYSMLGGIHFEEQRETQAVEAFRFAACLDDKNENRAKEYFYATRITNDTPTAFRFLVDRVKRFGSRSSLPARTLCWAHGQLEQTDQSLETLKEAYKIHKTDGDFLLYAAEYFAGWGKFEKAEKLLGKAKPISHASSWTRIAAVIASYQGKNSIALKHWQAMAKKDPLDVVAHRFTTGLLADEGGTEAAITYLRKYVALFPYSYSLRMMLIEWMSDETKEESEKELKEFLQHHPNDAWAMRELAVLYIGHRDFEAAQQYIEKAHEVDPNGPGTYVLRGRLHHSRNEIALAIEQYRAAVRHSIDNEFAMAGLIQCCNSKSERESQLRFVLGELKRQVGLGDGLVTFHALAQTCLDPKKLLATQREILAQGDDRWQAWATVIRQLSDMQQHEEARELATKATKKFPLLPRMWMELASVNAAMGRIDDEVQALQKAKEINPIWGDLIRTLSEAYEKQGDLENARKEIEASIRAEPRDVVNLGLLATIMWEQDEKEEALQLVTKAVRMQPGYDFGWMALRNWCAELGKPDYDVEVAKELTESRPNEPRSWMMLALALDQPHQVEEAIAALDKGLELNPHNIECYSQKAILYSQLGRYEEALTAVQPAALSNEMPIELVARAAWVEGQRGNFEVAVASMEKVLNKDPDYFWAWQELAQWYRFLEKLPQYMKAAKEMVRIQPQNAVSWGYLGDCELARDQLDKATKHFTQAVHLAPTYEYASSRLLDILIQQESWEEAKEILDFVTPHLSPEWVVSEQARIAALSGDQELAFEKLKALCEMPSEDHEAIDGAVEAMYVADWANETLDFLTQELDKPDALPGVAFVFVHLKTTMGQWDECEQRVNLLRSRPALWEPAAEKFMVEASTAESHGQQHRMKKFMADNDQALRGSTNMWEHVGTALCRGGMDGDVCSFMSDWRDRKDATVWGLFVLTCALWGENREHEANPVSTHAIRNLKPDSATENHLVFAAAYQIIYGTPELAFEYIRDVDPIGMSTIPSQFYRYVVGVLQNLGSDGSYGSLRDELKDAFESQSEEDKTDVECIRGYRLFQYGAARLHGKKFRAMKWKFQAK